MDSPKLTWLVLLIALPSMACSPKNKQVGGRFPGPDGLQKAAKMVKLGQSDTDVIMNLGPPNFVDDPVYRLGSVEDVGKGVAIAFHYRSWTSIDPPILSDLIITFHKDTGRVWGVKVVQPK